MASAATRAHDEGNTACAAVITPNAVWWPGRAYAKDAAPSVAVVLDGAGRGMAKYSTVVYAGVAQPQRAERVHGWKDWHAGPWTVYRGQDTMAGALVAVGYLDGMDSRQLGTLFDATTPASVLVDRLQRFGRATGFPWCGTAASTAMFALRLTWENIAEKPLWHWRAPVDKVSSGALIWEREPSRGEAVCPSWSWDVNGSHLAAAGVAEVAWSALRRTGGILFDKRVPGYWLVDVPPAEHYAAPPVVDAEELDGAGRAWVTTAVAEWLQQRHGRVYVLDSWTGREVERHHAAGRVFRRWYEQLRAARLHCDQDVLPAVKRTYAAVTGGLQHESMPVYRPDWAHAIYDGARVSLLRRIWRVYERHGVWPTKVNTDEVTYRLPPHYIARVEESLGVDLTGRKLADLKRVGGWTL